MDTNASGWLFSTAERRWERKPGKPPVCSLGNSLNTPWAWFGVSLERGHHLVGFLGGGVWTEAAKPLHACMDYIIHI